MQPQILVPLDGSALAETVLPPTGRLAHATGSSLVLIRVVAPALPHPLAGAVAPTAWEYDAWEAAWVQARAYLEGVAEDMAAQGLDVQTDVLEGDPAPVIVEYAREHPAVQTIALATHGRTGVLRWVLGSVADAVLHAAPLPVLLVGPLAASPHAQQPQSSEAPPATDPLLENIK